MVTKRSCSPGDLLFGKTRQVILGLLFSHPDESYHLRLIVRLTGAGLGPAQRELTKLASAALVTRVQRGRQVYYQANSKSPVFEELRGLVIKTAGLVDVLRAALEPLRERIAAAFVFGSIARGEESKDSDVDLMLIGGVRMAEVAKALSAQMWKVGREINPIIYPPAELARKLASGHHFVSQVLGGEKIFLIGDEHELAGLAKTRLDPSASNKSRRDRELAQRG